MCIWYCNYFLLPPQRWVGAHATTTLLSWAIIVWAWYLTRPWWFLSWKAQRSTQFVKKSKFLQQIWGWWIGHLSPKCILVGPTIALIIRINVWAMQLIKLPFPCSNSWNKSRCWEHSHCYHLPFGVKYWVWCNYTTIYQFDLLPFTTK